MRVFICADMEGVSGNVTRKQTDDYSSREYAAACVRMQDDVLSAVEACRQAGAVEIVVADSHGPGTNLDPDAFRPDTSLVQGWPRPLNMMQGIEQGHYNAAILIGHHASINSTEGGFPHSFSSGHFHAVKINGTVVSESLLNCAVAGHFGVPVVAISGDDACIAELREHMPDLEAAVTKKSHGMYAATQVPRPLALIAINEAVSRALEKSLPRPLIIEGPIDLQLTLKNRYFAEVLSYLPHWERRNAFDISVTLPDIPAAVKVIGALIHMNVDCY